jgi:hypothetical protein
MYKLSNHAELRIKSRLGGLTNRDEVLSKINKVSTKLTQHRNYVLIKKFPYIEIQDSEVKPDGIARGDMLIALVEEGIIETVILRKSWSQSTEFKRIIH